MKQDILKRRADFLGWEFGVFFHFGIRTFYPGLRNWDTAPMPPEGFDPQALDCEQWIRESKAAGASYAVFVCKHHDGFANWPSRYSDYSVAQSPWKNGQGDVVAEFVAACRKYDMKVGLYYSPAQFGGTVSFEDEAAYDEYFIRQISELLTQYGKVDYLWFDGCGSENHEYDKKRIVDTIRSLQPEILIFNMWDPDTAWIGNEDGYAPMANSNFRDCVDFSMMTEEKEGLEEKQFLPAECDCKIRSTWFCGEAGEDRLKTVDELVGMYEMSVGRGANFLLNLGPGPDGRLLPSDVIRLRELGNELRRRYGAPLSEFGPVEADLEGSFSICAPAAVEVNRVILQEDVLKSRISSFRIYAHLPDYTTRRICVYRGDTVGHKAICLFPTIRTARLTLEAEDDTGAPEVISMQAFFVR